VPMPVPLSAAEARGAALAAQGLTNRTAYALAGSDAPAAQLRALAARLQVFQIDPINVLVRAQYLPAFSRLGRYPVAALDDLAYGRRELFEYAGHEWSLLPVALHPLLRWRMHAFANDPRWPRDLPDGYPEQVLAEVADRGPLTASELAAAGHRESRFEGRPGKKALTWLTQSGRLAVAGRRGGVPVYDLAARVIPAEVLDAPAPARDDACRELLVLAARALGVATVRDLASYFLIGMGVAGFSERTVYPGATTVAQLVTGLAADGRLRPARVEGWSRPAFLHPDVDVAAAGPVQGAAGALLAPFDPLIWDRDRTERLFGFRYRSEIYTPPAKREYGYYVLPFLLGDTLVARVDLRADRQAAALAVLGAFAEPDVQHRPVAAALGTQLRAMADWLELDTVTVDKHGDLSDELSRGVPTG
jgi:uncharacterized protein YcaQ